MFPAAALWVSRVQGLQWNLPERPAGTVHICGRPAFDLSYFASPTQSCEMQLNLTHKEGEAGQVNHVPMTAWLPDAGLAPARLQVWNPLPVLQLRPPTTPRRLFIPNPLLLITLWKDRQAGP